jgi:hypothetical protein
MGSSFSDILSETIARESEAPPPPRTSPGPDTTFADALKGFENRVARAFGDEEPGWARTLGVSKTASESELRRAFRRCAFAAHPDRGGSAERFMQVQAALDEGLASAAGRRIDILRAPTVRTAYRTVPRPSRTEPYVTVTA